MRPRAPRPANADAGDTVQVVVHDGATGRTGLVIGKILDIVEENVTGRASSHRPGVLFTAVIEDKVTEVLDVDEIIRLAHHQTSAVKEEV